ncbi:MAG: hypothetical protein ACUVV3_03850 [Dehalococcoidia bacterium]
MDGRKNERPGNIPQKQGFAASLPEWARERENRQWYEPAATRHSPRQAKPKAPTKLIVFLRDAGEDEWAKARIFDEPKAATALVEALVESGLAPQKVSVFSATQLVVDVAYQPLVELKDSQKQGRPPATA